MREPAFLFWTKKVFPVAVEAMRIFKALPEVREAAEMEATLVVELVDTISKLPVKDAPPEKTLVADQVLAVDLLATPDVPQLILTKP